MNFSFGKKYLCCFQFFLDKLFLQDAVINNKVCIFWRHLFFYTTFLTTTHPQHPQHFFHYLFHFISVSEPLCFPVFIFFPPPFLYLFFRAYPSMLDFTTTIQGHLIDTGSRYNNSAAHCFLRIIKS